MPPHETCRKSKDAALKAIELDEGLAEGYAALSHMKTFYDWDFKEAERLAKRAVELDPNCSTAHPAYGEVLFRTGRREEAASHNETVRKLEPLSPMFNVFSASTSKDPAKQLEQIRLAIDLDPKFYYSFLEAGHIYRKHKMYQEAYDAYTTAKHLAPDQHWSDAVGMVPLLIEMGRRDEVEKILSDMIRSSETRFVSPGIIAIVLKNLGRTDEAFEWLEKGYQQRDSRMVNLKAGPIWQDVQEDPRMKDLLKRIGFD
jgi:tetratricopeptide (TPR) repeat protein